MIIDKNCSNKKDVHNILSPTVITLLLLIYSLFLLGIYWAFITILDGLEIYEVWESPRGQDYLWKYRGISWLSFKIINIPGRENFAVLMILFISLAVFIKIKSREKLAQFATKIFYFLILFFTLIIMGMFFLLSPPLWPVLILCTTPY